MAAFAKSTFSHSSYASFRPSYPPALYDTVLNYHYGPKNLCVDLGCGHGAVARYLSDSFTRVIGTDPSRGMLEQARSMTPKEQYRNVEYKEATAEDSPFLEKGSVDMVVAGQAAHWFDYKTLFPELKRIVRQKGTLAFWGYKDHVFVDYPRATKILERYAYGNDDRLLGPYWPQPGRSIVEGKLQVIKPPTSDWEDIQRIEYEPALNGPRSGQGTMFMNRRLTLKECMAYIRTWSSFHGWQEKHPEMKRKEDGGDGDVVDEMFEVMVDTEEDWRKDGDWREKEVEIEWGSGLLLARRKNRDLGTVINSGTLQAIATKRPKIINSPQPLLLRHKKTVKHASLYTTKAAPITITLATISESYRDNTYQKAHTDNKEFLDKLNGDSDSSLSDITSSDFEDVIADEVHPKRRKFEEDVTEEEEMDWEDAMVPDVSLSGTHVTTTSKDLELTLGKEAKTSSFTDPHGKKKGPSKRDREIRIATHCMHVQFLMYHNAVRNAWICDDEVQKNLVAQLPQGVRKAVEKWELASGIPVERPQEDGAKTPARVKGKQVGQRKATKVVHQRDWGQKAERQEEGTPNMSRGDPLIRLLKILAAYWRKSFKITAPGLRKQGYKPLSVLAREIASFRNDSHNAEEHGERINDITEFRELAKKCEGSRDVGAQLFTALVRGLGLEARMVASLQPAGFGWSKNEEAAPKRKRGGQNVADKVSGLSEPMNPDNSMESEDSSSESEMSTDGSAAVDRKNSNVELSAGAQAVDPRKKTGKGKGLRGKPIDLSESSDSALATDEDDDLSVVEVSPQLARKTFVSRFDRDLPFPIYWTEVASPITKRIIPADPLVLNPPVATNDVLLSSFEPRGAKADKAKQVIAYVLAFSSDGTAKDVTTRYLKRHMWPGKTKGMRLPVEKVPIHNKRGKVKGYEEYDWFKTVMSGYKRTDKMRTAVDDVEDMTDLKPVKPEKRVAAEGEETLQGYKNSAEFVLERHLRREEALLPGAQHVRVFKSGKAEKAKEEKVFRREDVVVCRTGESWHKEGRQVKPGEYPMKMVLVRAVTLMRKREVEEAERDTGEKLKQGLYAWDQTDWIIPPPIENGVIPKNAFGNIDCYVPTMVPKGAVHIRHKGTVKVCKRLGIDFAEAVTGFEFGKQRAVPVVTGVVVAKEYEKTVRDAWEMDEEERRKKEEGKREKIALAMWRKFLMGLRIVERVRDEYGGDASAHIKEEMNPFTNRNKRKQQASNTNSDSHFAKHEGDLDNDDHGMAGGFIPEDHMDAVDGGGFVPEFDEIGGMDAEPKSIPKGRAGRATESIADTSDKTPRSLQSAHRDASRALPRSGASEEASTERFPPLAGNFAKNKSLKRGSKASNSQQKADLKSVIVGGTAGNLTKGRRQTARITKPDTDESSDLTSLEHTSESDGGTSAKGRRRISRANRGVADKDRSLLLVSQETPLDPTARHSNGVMLKRNAARKSDTAGRSRYFEQDGTEDEDDLDNGTSDERRISASRKRKTTSTGNIRKPQVRIYNEVYPNRG